jgi:hypothetical protein
MPGDLDMVDIVHRRAADATVVPLEPERFDEIYGHPEAGTEAQDRTDISGDFRFKEGDPHSGLIAPARKHRKFPAAAESRNQQRLSSSGQQVLGTCASRRYQARQSRWATAWRGVA